MDLRSIGGTSLPDPSILRKSAHLLPPKVLQIASVRDVSRSSFADGSRGSSNRRLLKMALTDGQTEITAIEYSFISSLPDDVVPGTKIRLEKKAMIRSGIVCLSPDVITVLGGVVQSLHEEWQMNQKYAGFSRSSLRIVQEGDAGGPPPFEKLKIGGPKRGSAQDASRNTGSPLVESCKTSEVKLTDRKQEPEVEADIDNDLNTTRLSQKAEEKPSSSETRPKEVAEFVPLQNQAAAQKLLQRMNHPNQRNRQNGGKKYRGKGKEKETPVFTLDEWERRKAGAIPLPKAEAPGVSNDEYLAWQLQNQFDLEDQVQGNPYQGEAENIKMSVFSFERDGGGGRGRSEVLLDEQELEARAWGKSLDFAKTLGIQFIELGKGRRTGKSMDESFARNEDYSLERVNLSPSLEVKRNNHLDLPGASIVFIALAIHFTAGLRYGMMLLVYLLDSFWVKRNGAARNERSASMRWQKVLPQTAVPVIWVLMVLKYRGWEDKCIGLFEGSIAITSVIGAIIGHYAFLMGHYPLYEQPGSTTNSQPHRTSVNAVGLDWLPRMRAARGGLFIVLTFVIFGHLTIKCSSDQVQWIQWFIAPLGAFAGLQGRIIYAIVSLTLPFRGYCFACGRVVREPGPTVIKLIGNDLLDDNSAYLVSMVLNGLITSKMLATVIEQLAFDS
ncbi:hypothetical protein Ancab_035339 [Ancistrocladus abbreviatus]